MAQAQDTRSGHTNTNPNPHTHTRNTQGKHTPDVAMPSIKVTSADAAPRVPLCRPHVAIRVGWRQRRLV